MVRWRGLVGWVYWWGSMSVPVLVVSVRGVSCGFVGGVGVFIWGRQ